MADVDPTPDDAQTGARTAAAVRPMQTLRTDLMLDLLAAPTSELLFLREFAVNGCEAIRDAGKNSGTVLFDVDRRQLACTGLARLSIVDDGVGMRAEELVRYIGNLSSSGKDHRVGANHGVGAKIAGARASPRGIEFRSWRGGVGWMVVLCQHASGVWGLRDLRPDAPGDERYVLALADDERPALLGDPRRSDGTQVTFLGATDDAHTYVAPRVVSEGRSMWVRRYLNDRLYEIPAGARIVVRENVARDERSQSWTAGVCREVVGARVLLDAHSESSGTVALSDARCHWWVLAKPRSRGRAVAREWAATGYFGLLHAGEILESQKGMHGGQQGLTSHFKIRLGPERVVLLVEPDDAATVKSDIARTTLSIDGRPLPWVRWGREFAEGMPDAISALQRALVDDVSGGRRRRQAVAARWARVSGPIVALLRVPPRPRARDPRVIEHPHAGGSHVPAATPGRPVVAEQPELGCAGPPRSATRKQQRPHDAIGRRAEPAARTAVRLRYPTTLWLPAGEVPGDLHNRAARYDPGDDVLTISPEFPVYLAQLDRLLEEYGTDPQAGAVITEKLRQWWELTLVEAVDMARRLAADDRELRLLTSPWSLSSAVSAPSPIAQHLRREVPLQLGRHAALGGRTARSDGDIGEASAAG